MVVVVVVAVAEAVAVAVAVVVAVAVAVAVVSLYESLCPDETHEGESGIRRRGLVY